MNNIFNKEILDIYKKNLQSNKKELQDEIEDLKPKAFEYLHACSFINIEENKSNATDTKNLINEKELEIKLIDLKLESINKIGVKEILEDLNKKFNNL